MPAVPPSRAATRRPGADGAAVTVDVLTRRLRELQRALPEIRERVDEARAWLDHRTQGEAMTCTTNRCILDPGHRGPCVLPRADDESEAPYDDGGRTASPARIERVLRREALRIAVSQQQAPNETAKTTIARARVYYEFLNT